MTSSSLTTLGHVLVVALMFFTAATRIADALELTVEWFRTRRTR